MQISKLLSTASLAVAVAACIGPNPTTATLATTTTAPTTTTTLAPLEALADFTTCLEDRGVVVPELALGDDGRVDLGGLAVSNDVSTPGFRGALSDCTPLLAANGLLDLSADPALTAAVRRQLQRFAQCMREAGVDQFPDPADDFDGTRPPFPAEAVPVGDPDLAIAIETCGTKLGLAPITG